MESRDKEINLIAGRIMDEYRKYPSLEWNKIAASKIHSQWFEYFSKQTKELQQKVEQLQFELKAADSDYHYKTKALTDEIEELKQSNKRYQQDYSDLQNRVIKQSEMLKFEHQENVRLQSELKAADSGKFEFETKVLESIAPALKYFNGFNSPDQNEAAFHGLNNLNNYVTNNPKTN